MLAGGAGDLKFPPVAPGLGECVAKPVMCCWSRILLSGDKIRLTHPVVGLLPHVLCAVQ